MGKFRLRPKPSTALEQSIQGMHKESMWVPSIPVGVCMGFGRFAVYRNKYVHVLQLPLSDSHLTQDFQSELVKRHRKKSSSIWSTALARLKNS